MVRLFLTRDAAPADDIKTELLADIKEVFVDKDRMCSADLVPALVGMEDRPWATWGKGSKGINQNQLARLLKDFKIYPKTVRLDDGRRLKGYERQWFQPGLEPLPISYRYSNRDSVTTRKNLERNASLEP